MLLIRGERNDFTGRTKWEKVAVDVDFQSITVGVRQFSNKKIYYTDNYYYGKQSKNNPCKTGDRMQTLYKEEL